MSYLSTLITGAWAIREEWLPLLANTLARIATGAQISAADRTRIDTRRDEFRAAHPQAARGSDDPFVRIPTADAGGRGVALIGVYGVLCQRGGIDADTSEPLTSTARLARAIQAAAADPTIGAIVLDVDSPGGSVYGLSELADAIYAARSAKPTVAIANSCAASAAYWAASQAGELYCAPGGEVGSIGVKALHTDVSAALQKSGVAVTELAAGRFKLELSSFAPLSAEARAHAQATIDQYYNDFVKAVARGRSTTPKAVLAGMGQGRMLTTSAAQAENMIDGVATLDAVIARMAARIQRRASSSASSPAGSVRARMQRETDLLEHS
jgi:signal peptide peptidase SppA